MAVRVCDRTESKAQFTEIVRKLNVRLGQILANGPKKYSRLYGAKLVGVAFELYKECLMANRIYLAVKSCNFICDYRQRREHLLNAKGLVTVMSAELKVYFDLMLNSHEYSYPRGDDAILTEEQARAKRASEKAIGRMKEMGEMLAKEDKLLNGVIASDTKLLREYNANLVPAR